MFILSYKLFYFTEMTNETIYGILSSKKTSQEPVCVLQVAERIREFSYNRIIRDSNWMYFNYFIIRKHLSKKQFNSSELQFDSAQLMPARVQRVLWKSGATQSGVVEIISISHDKSKIKSLIWRFTTWKWDAIKDSKLDDNSQCNVGKESMIPSNYEIHTLTF